MKTLLGDFPGISLYIFLGIIGIHWGFFLGSGIISDSSGILEGFFEDAAE